MTTALKLISGLISDPPGTKQCPIDHDGHIGLDICGGPMEPISVNLFTDVLEV